MVMEEAILWTIRLRHADSHEWEEFTGWLEADPAHLRAYEEVAAVDDAAAALLGSSSRKPVFTVEQPPRRSLGRRTVLGWGVAAAFAGAISFAVLKENPKPQIVETGFGERRMIALEDGTRIHVNGATRLSIDGDNPRLVTLERGEALFMVVHDASNPFRVEAGSAVIQNLGTIFNVVHERERLAAAVAEGAVRFSSHGAKVDLTAGMSVRQSGDRLIVSRGDAAAVGAWREGQLSYSSAPLSEVAQDLSRNTGLAVKVSPDLAGRRFSGVIVLDGDRPRLLRRVAALLEVDVRPAGDGWILTSSDK